MRESYGIDLVSDYEMEDKKLLSLQEKKSNQTSLGRKEVVYVKKGLYNIGKLSISYQTSFGGKTSMSFVYQIRRHYPRSIKIGDNKGTKHRVRRRGTY